MELAICNKVRIKIIRSLRQIQLPYLFISFLREKLRLKIGAYLLRSELEKNIDSSVALYDSYTRRILSR